MKKVFFLLVVLLLPFVVQAKGECNPNNIQVQSVVLEEKTNTTLENQEIGLTNNMVNLDLKMHEVGDSVKY